jgi:hypothetical protein
MKALEQITFEARQELIGFALEKIAELKGSKIYGCDLHNEIFNTDYYIIGTYKAEQWLIKNIGVFEAIGIIQEYEKFHFGSTYTDLSQPERLVNMLVYIAGEEILSESEVLKERWDEKLTDDDYDKIISEIEQLVEA